MSTKHTKGTWRHAPLTDGFMTFEAEDGSPIIRGCGCCMSPSGRSDDCGHTFYNPCDEDHANARLIASAPELLSALEQLIDAVASTDEADICIALDSANRVASKARGEA